MAEPSFEHLEARLQQAAAEFPYPPTPPVSRLPRLPNAQRSAQRAAGARRLAWGLALAALILLAGLFSVPAVRAAVAEFLQIGAVRIIQTTAIPSPAPTASAPSGVIAPITATPASATPRPTPMDLAPLENLGGETTLAEARQRLSFAVRLPTYPPELGEPQRVFLQDLRGYLLILVWTDPARPERARLSLHIITPGSFTLEKVKPRVVRTTQVHGLPAVWAEGPYLLNVKNGDTNIWRLIEGHVLIWEEDGVTYRLESDVTLEEAVKIAESLQ